MCGIIGIVGTSTVTDRLIDGLKRLEYRGYDSAGIAVLDDGNLKRERAKGKIKSLESKINGHPLNGAVGIAHTRWATHGVPNEANAHPHFAGRVAIVHNGIIENYQQIRNDLNGRNFQSDTDTEVVAHLVDEALKSGLTPAEAFSTSLKKLRGAYALGLVIEDQDNVIYAARAGSPLAIGIGQGEMYLGSDALALAELSSELVYLEEGDWAILTADSYQIFDQDDRPVNRDVTLVSGAKMSAHKDGFDHYMLKEIYEQEVTVGHTLSAYIDAERHLPAPPVDIPFESTDRVILVACGSAKYAADVGKYWFEKVAGLAAEVDIASEFRYRHPVLSPNSIFFAVSQSGETADTLAALRYCKSKGLTTVALVNVMTSSMAREADIALPLNAGPEIGVASTKAYTSQLTALAALSLYAGHKRGTLSGDDLNAHVQALMDAPAYVSEALTENLKIKDIASHLSGKSHAFFLGRGPMVPIALEGSLKLKEISYIHAEGYPAGELKHGPIALIEPGTPVIVLAPHEELFEKTVSNTQEVRARGAEVYLVSQSKGISEAGDLATFGLRLPDCPDFIMPIIASIPMQLLSYHTAVHLGTDVDQPRNLAKSVTVE